MIDSLSCCVRTLPSEDNTIGFFVACFERVGKCDRFTSFFEIFISYYYYFVLLELVYI